MTNGTDPILVQNRIDFVTGAVRRYVEDVDHLTRIRERVHVLVEDRSTIDLRKDPAEGEWSAVRVLGHMIAYARVLHDQLYRMSWMTDPVLPAADDAAEAERNDWRARDPRRLLQWFDEAMDQIEGLLTHLPDSSWGRAGLHPTLGRRSIRQHVRSAVIHLGGHVEQIEAALAQ